MAYLAIYLGFVLVIACAAILAIQQLSDASDNAQRYGLLRKLGAPEGMISSALFVQVLVYFLFPLLLAVAHAACALVVVTDVVAVPGTSTSRRWRYLRRRVPGGVRRLLRGDVRRRPEARARIGMMSPRRPSLPGSAMKRRGS